MGGYIIDLYVFCFFKRIKVEKLDFYFISGRKIFLKASAENVEKSYVGTLVGVSVLIWKFFCIFREGNLSLEFCIRI